MQSHSLNSHLKTRGLFKSVSFIFFAPQRMWRLPFALYRNNGQCTDLLRAVITHTPSNSFCHTGVILYIKYTVQVQACLECGRILPMKLHQLSNNTITIYPIVQFCNILEVLLSFVIMNVLKTFFSCLNSKSETVGQGRPCKDDFKSCLLTYVLCSHFKKPLIGSL